MKASVSLDSIRQQEEEEYIDKEEILAGIKSGLEDVKAGRTQSFDEFMKELVEV